MGARRARPARSGDPARLPRSSRRPTPAATRSSPTARGASIPVTIHTGINFTPHGPIDFGRPIWVDRVACDFPNLMIVCNHGGWPWVTESLAVAWKHNNVYLEFGAIAPKYLADPRGGWQPLPTGCGPGHERVLLGTDWPMLRYERLRRGDAAARATARGPRGLHRRQCAEDHRPRLGVRRGRDGFAARQAGAGAGGGGRGRPPRPARPGAADLGPGRGARAADGGRAGVREARGAGALVTYSPKVFIPLTKLCRDVCHYCTFAAAAAARRARVHDGRRGARDRARRRRGRLHGGALHARRQARAALPRPRGRSCARSAARRRSSTSCASAGGARRDRPAAAR